MSIESSSDLTDLAIKLRENTAAMEADGYRLVAISHAVESGDVPLKYTAVLAYFRP